VCAALRSCLRVLATLMKGPGGDERTEGWPRGVLLGESGFVTS